MAGWDDWTRVSWWILFVFASFYPIKPTEAKRKSTVEFLKNFAIHLPCGSCGMHMLEYLEKNPVYEHTISPDKLLEYLYHFKESVNERTGKKSNLTLEDVKKMFDPRKSWKQTGLYPILGNDELKQFLKMKETLDKVPLEGGNDMRENIFPAYVVYVLIIALLLTISISGIAIYMMYRSKKNLITNKA